MSFGGSLLLQICRRLRRRYRRPDAPSSSVSIVSTSSHHTSHKRKVPDSPLPETQGKKRRRGEVSVSSSLKAPAPLAKVKTVTLEEIRSLPPPQTHPYYPRKLHRGTSSIKEPRPWTCEACKSENGLIPHLIYGLPVFRCKSCGSDPPEGATDFGFCYGDLAFNEACPIGHVKAQELSECIANAVASSMEISHRVMMTILEDHLDKEGAFVDITDMLAKSRKRWIKKELDDELDEYNQFGIESLFAMLDVCHLDGVKAKVSSASDNPEKILRITGYSFLPEGDFVAAASALADGYPLIVGFQTGKRLCHLKPGEVYVPPVGALSTRIGS